MTALDVLIVIGTVGLWRCWIVTIAIFLFIYCNWFVFTIVIDHIFVSVIF